MNDKEWFNFCVEEYRRSADRSEIMYSRYGFVLTSIVAICAADYYLLSLELETYDADSVFSLGSVVFCLLCGLMLFTSTILLMQAVIGSTKFRDLQTTSEFHKHAEEYYQEIVESHKENPELHTQWKQETLAEGLLRAMQEAEEANHKAIDDRLRWSNAAFLHVSIAGICLLTAGLLQLTPKIFFIGSM